MPYIFKNITLEQIEASQPKMIWVARHTGWWTHRREDLRKCQDGTLGDPMAGPVDAIHNVKDFLKWVKIKALEGKYGRLGVVAFIAAHNDNCKVSKTDLRSTCLVTWKEYTDCINAQTTAPPEPVYEAADPTLGTIPEKFVRHEANPKMLGRENDDGPNEGETGN